MISRLIRISILAILAIGLAGSAAAGSAVSAMGEGQPRALERPVVFVITADVSWVEPPSRLGLAGGWTVELAEPSLDLNDLAVMIASGNAQQVRVIGERTPGRRDKLVRRAEFVIPTMHHITAPGRHGRKTAPTDVQLATVPIRHRSSALKDGDTFEGYLSSFIPDGLTLDVNATTEYDVIVNGETEFDGFAALTDLTIGDFLEVRGQVNGSTIIAERIRLRDDGGESTLEGAITGFTSSGFELDVGSTIYEVVITSETLFQNFGSLSDLQIGDDVKAKGDLQETTLTATEVELISGGGKRDGR